MIHLLSELQNAIVLPEGQLITEAGVATGFSIQPGGHQLYNARGQLIGTLTLTGRLYDRDGRLVAQVVRNDLMPDTV
ncbi:hypothetical protein K2Z83_14585 [Oscillochloris sp. ZM17-4]|uniref:hypothetical protein n=1 Tax=Oscillochloris sp. ZM17-4 TaxID=2866714 RepID=UPI001C72F063|nr:hypothetical protein [Oscillochloris sp. ZM17-4]MBX0328904.1 hypothetical protein [Oscillochloris sp. ZM17-4]